MTKKCRIDNANVRGWKMQDYTQTSDIPKETVSVGSVIIICTTVTLQ